MHFLALGTLVINYVFNGLPIFNPLETHMYLAKLFIKEIFLGIPHSVRISTFNRQVILPLFFFMHVDRAVLGSVSDYCAHHAKCPVVIVKKPHKKTHLHQQ